MGGGRWPWRHALCGRKAAPEGGPSQCQTAASQRPRCIALGDGDPCIGSDPDHDGFRPQSLTMRHGITSFRWLRHTNNLGAEAARGKACAAQTRPVTAIHRHRHCRLRAANRALEPAAGAGDMRPTPQHRYILIDIADSNQTSEIAMKISARNRLAGTVAELKTG